MELSHTTLNINHCKADGNKPCNLCNEYCPLSVDMYMYIAGLQMTRITFWLHFVLNKCIWRWSPIQQYSGDLQCTWTPMGPARSLPSLRSMMRGTWFMPRAAASPTRPCGAPWGFELQGTSNCVSNSTALSSMTVVLTLRCSKKASQ